MGTSMESRQVQTCLGWIHLRIAGSGPALMFWPSLLMDGSMWSAQAAHFSDRYRVILVDSPGHGESEPLTRLFSFEECARSIVEILDALDIGRVHFVGNSWGGMIGGTFAATYPDRVGASILMNCTASACGWQQKLEYFLLTRILWLAGRVPGFMVGKAVDAFIGPTSARERPQVGETIRAAVGRANARSVYWAIRSVVPSRPDQHGLMGRITTPVLVVAGEEDRTFPVAETAAMAKSIPGAEFTVMKRTAHLAGLECPAEVNALIDDFLARHP